MKDKNNKSITGGYGKPSSFTVEPYIPIEYKEKEKTSTEKRMFTKPQEFVM